MSLCQDLAHYGGIILSIIALLSHVSIIEHNSIIVEHNEVKCLFKTEKTRSTEAEEG